MRDIARERLNARRNSGGRQARAEGIPSLRVSEGGPPELIINIRKRFGQLCAKGCIASLLPIPSRTGDTNEPGGHSADDGKFLLRETEISSPFLVDFSHTALASSRLS